MNDKKIAVIISDILVPILVLIIAITAYTTENLRPLSELGEWAYRFLILLLILKPMSVALPKLEFLKKSLVYRREIGHIVFFFAAGHGLMYIITSGFYIVTGYILGSIALFILFTMFLTSNKTSIVKMGIWWKRLHSLIYLVLILTIAHVYFITGEVEGEIWIPFALLIIFKIIECFKTENKKTDNKKKK